MISKWISTAIDHTSKIIVKYANHFNDFLTGNHILPGTTVSVASLDTVAPNLFFARHWYEPDSREDNLDRRRFLFRNWCSKGAPLWNLPNEKDELNNFINIFFTFVYGN